MLFLHLHETRIFRRIECIPPVYLVSSYSTEPKGIVCKQTSLLIGARNLDTMTIKCTLLCVNKCTSERDREKNADYDLVNNRPSERRV